MGVYGGGLGAGSWTPRMWEQALASIVVHGLTRQSGLL